MKGKIFNTNEVQSIIAGTKTMFREVIKNKTNFCDFLQTREAGDKWHKDRVISMRGKCVLWGYYALKNFVEKFCPYQVGQKIFVKERFNIFAGQVSYKQGLVGAERYFWKPAQHMKQEHSRLTLEITDIKVERLKEIDIKDVYKEGLPNHRLGQTFMWFEEHWNASHKKPEEKFEVNPFVWVVDFKINK